MPALITRAQLWSGVAAVVLIVGALLPPASGYARHYAFAQALQFVIFAVAGPALLALAIPRRARPRRLPGGGRPIRPAARAAVRLMAFVVVAAVWRLPAAVSALARDPAFACAEMITLLAVGTGVWMELAAPRAASRQLPAPVRAAMAAAATWTIWVLAYLTGMSGTSWLAAYHRGAPGGLSAAADQQIATAILWAVPAACFLPVVFVTVITWLSGTGSAEDQRRAASAGTPGAVPRPPRGWHSPDVR